MEVKGFKLSTVVIIVLITSILSSVTTGLVLNFSYKISSGLSYMELLDDDYLNEFLQIYSKVKKNFYGEYDEIGLLNAAAVSMVSYEGDDFTQLISYATEGMLEYLGDDYTTFLNSGQYDVLSSELAGTYQGIGITIQGNVILSVTKDSPADEAGLQQDDIIVKVDNQVITYDNSSYISVIIKSSSSDKVNIIVDRDGEEISFLVYKTLLDSSTKKFMIDDSLIGYIQLSVFSDYCFDSFNNALVELEDEGMESLIIDLRYNGGGYLDKAVDIASLFLDEGDIINSLVSNNGKTINYDETKESRDYEILILINEESASASEILAAALIDNYKAKSVGTNTYGKGTVQQLIESSNGIAAKYTTAYWYTPNDICINNIGISPDYYVELEYIYNDDGEKVAYVDSQLRTAIEMLKEA